ncbi:MAG TPA: RHS repeat-associated core domain-containing protein [Armatimonadota bacterium]
MLGNRYYDPAIGRFISQDPAQDESNWYAYCGNNPLVAVDSYPHPPSPNVPCPPRRLAPYLGLTRLPRPNQRAVARVSSGGSYAGYGQISEQGGTRGPRYPERSVGVLEPFNFSPL